MKHLNRKHGLQLLVGISIIVFIILFIIYKYLKPPETTNFDYLKIAIFLIPNVVTFDTVVLWVFFNHAWKWSLFKGWLVPLPDLNGTWKGSIQTTWKDPITGERPAAIPAILTVNQTLDCISCVMRTHEMTSYSFICDFILDEPNQVKKLSYSYSSTPKQIVIERSPQHFGTIIFEIDEKPKIKLIGEYWTGRKTTGNITMEFWKRRKLNSFPDDVGPHPVSEIRKNQS